MIKALVVTTKHCLEIHWQQMSSALGDLTMHIAHVQSQKAARTSSSLLSWRLLSTEDNPIMMKSGWQQEQKEWHFVSTLNWPAQLQMYMATLVIATNAAEGSSIVALMYLVNSYCYRIQYTFWINVVHTTSWSWLLSTPWIHVLTSTCPNIHKVIVHQFSYTGYHLLSLHNCQVWHYLPDVRLILSKSYNNISCRCFLCASLLFSLWGAVGPFNAQHMWSQQKVKATASWKDTMQAS